MTVQDCVRGVAHDAAGNMTTVPQPGSWSTNFDLVYDAWNRLVEVKDGMTTVAEYEYDGLHRRTVKTVGSDIKHFYYNTSWQVVEVRDASETGTTVEEYVWHPYYVDALAVRYWDSDEDSDYASIDETHYFTHDANQNITAALQHGSAVKERYLYKPYGGVEVVTAAFGAQSGSAIDNPYFFTGRRLDDETGLYHFRNRFYHAELGRFVSRDFLEYPDGMNLYGAYFAPGGLDPSGLINYDFMYEPKPDPPKEKETPHSAPPNPYGHYFHNGCDDLLDVSLGFIPGATWPTTVPALITGTNPITGDELSNVDYAITIFALVPGGKAVGRGGKFCANKCSILSKRFRGLPPKVPGKVGFTPPKKPRPPRKPRPPKHTDDQILFKDLVDEASNGGRKELTMEEANAILDLAEEVKYPGWRAGPGDVGGTWAGGEGHIHIPGVGSGHINVPLGLPPRFNPNKPPRKR